MKTQCISPQSHPGERISLNEVELKHPSFSSRFIAILHESVREVALRGEAFDLEAIFDCRLQDDGQLWIHYSALSRKTVLRIPADHWAHAKNFKSASVIGGLIWSMFQTYDRSQRLVG